MRLILLLLIIKCCTAQIYEEPEWFSDFITIRSSLIDGRNLRITNALPEYLLDFDYENIDWEERVGKNEYGKVWFRRKECEECTTEIEDWLMSHADLFNILVPLKNITKVSLALTKYEEGDFLEMHNDYGTRLLSFVLHLNDMNPKCGGEFIWAGELGIKKAPPMRNVLYLFLPSTSSFHMIETVRCNERYAVSGWFY